MPIFIKKFLEWIGVKIKLDNSNHKPPLFNEGEIWWCSVGENVGREINGKGENFWRPVLIIRKINKYSFIGLPLTSQYKFGPWFSQLCFHGKENYVVLIQVHFYDYKRMHRKIVSISFNELKRIREDFVKLLLRK